jgi:hypothetical protein
LLTYLHIRKQRKAGKFIERKDSSKKTRFNPLSSLKLFLDKETCILLLYGGVIYSVNYFVLTTLPPQIQAHYNFNVLQTSLCFLATGFGTMAAVLLVGPLLDWNFRRHAKLLGMEISNNKQQDLKDYPIEVARLQVSFPLLFLSAASLVAYGWTLQANTPLAAPIIFLFLTSFGNAGSFAGFNNLIVDLNRDSPGTTTAAMNLARNWMGAGGVAFANPLTNAIGMGWACVFIAGVWMMFVPFVIWAVKSGPGWRREKQRKKEARWLQKEQS